VTSVSYPIFRMIIHLETFLFSLCSVFLCMFVRLRVQCIESSLNKEFQEKKLVNSKTMIYSPHLKGLVQQELIYLARTQLLFAHL